MEVKKVDSISKTQKIPSVSSALQILNQNPQPHKIISSNVGSGIVSPFETISLKPIKSPTISNIKPIKVQHQEDDPINI